MWEKMQSIVAAFATNQIMCLPFFVFVVLNYNVMGAHVSTLTLTTISIVVAFTDSESLDVGFLGSS